MLPKPKDRSVVDYAAKKPVSSQRHDSAAIADDMAKKLTQLTLNTETKTAGDDASIQLSGDAEGKPPAEAELNAPTVDIPPVARERTIHVGNIPFRVRWQDLKDLFRKAGHVTRADVAMTPDNRSRGFGTVVFSNENEAKKAIAMFNQYQWQDRVLHVQEDKSNAEPPQGNEPHRGFPPNQERYVHGSEDAPPYFRHAPPMGQGFMSRQVFVGNIPFQCQWQDLKDLFRRAGHIVRADVAVGFDGRNRGFGSVLFTSQEDAQNAINIFNNFEFNGRILRVHYDRYAPMGHGLPMHTGMGPMMHPHLGQLPHTHALHSQHPPPHHLSHSLPHSRLHPIHAQHPHSFPGTFHQPPMLPLGSHPLIHGGALMHGQFRVGPMPQLLPQFNGGAFSPTTSLGSTITNGAGYPPLETSPQAGPDRAILSPPPANFKSTTANPLGAPSPSFTTGSAVVVSSPNSQSVQQSQPEPPSTQMYPFAVGLGPIGKPNVSHGHLNQTGPVSESSVVPSSLVAASTMPMTPPCNGSSDEFVPRSLNTLAQANAFGINTDGPLTRGLNGNDDISAFTPPFYMYPTILSKPFQRQTVGYPHYQDQSHLGPVGTLSSGNGHSGDYPNQPEWVTHPNVFSMGPPHHIYSGQSGQPFPPDFSDRTPSESHD
ncbi:hypothetical protein BG004_006425 [Podila humilis]|nr:hypothetical protein BG004_006425 [Podila humilis]